MQKVFIEPVKGKVEIDQTLTSHRSGFDRFAGNGFDWLAMTLMTNKKMKLQKSKAMIDCKDAIKFVFNSNTLLWWNFSSIKCFVSSFSSQGSIRTIVQIF